MNNAQMINKQQLIAFLKNLKKPMRLGQMARTLRIKGDQKKQLIFLLEELKKEGVIRSDTSKLTPNNFQEEVKEVILTEDLVYNYLLTRKRPVNPKEIIRALGANQENNYEILQEILFNFELTGKVLRKNETYLIFPINSRLRVGEVRMPKKGVGYVDDYIIDEEYLNGVLPGDIILIETSPYVKNRRGFVRRIIKRSDYPAPFTYENGSLIPFGFSFKYRTDMNPEMLKNFRSGDRIGLNLSMPQRNNICNITGVKFIANKQNPNVEYLTIAAKHGIDTDFTKEEQEELAKIPKTITKKDLDGRIDHRDLVTATMDGIKAKDMDDAYSLEKLKNGNNGVYVHIADVPHFIKKNSLLHKRAQRNAYTSYLNKVTFHLFPPIIANDICSLNEKVDRLTRTFYYEITPEGKVVDFQTYKSIINSNIKMTYEDVNQILEENKMVPGYEPYLELLRNVEKISSVLNIQTEDRGCLEFANTDPECDMDDNGNIVDFKTKEERTGQRIIKNLMLLAGQTIASHLKWLGIPFIQRVHESPDETKIKETINFINTLGYKTRHIRNISDPRSLQFILKQLSNVKEYPILSAMILRSIPRAFSSVDELGHYGLALPIYAQIGSPIRRVGDLEDLYILDEIENNFDYSIESLKEMEKYLQGVAALASIREKKIDEAVRDGLKMEMAKSMESKIGEYFNGYISEISREGITVITTGNIIGRVRFDKIRGGRYRFDETNKCLVCKNSGATMKVSDFVRIQVLAASAEDRTIDFAITQSLSIERKKENEKRKSYVIIPLPQR